LRSTSAFAFAFPLVLVLTLVACGGKAAPPATVARVDAGAPPEAAPTSDVGAACPEDATWTGAVCLGHGYVACPAGLALDEKGRCVSRADAGAPRRTPAPRPPEPDPAPAD